MKLRSVSSGLRSMVIAGLLATGAAAIYMRQLGDAPAYLGRDEMFFGLTAHSIASTGRDTAGRFMPLYFQTQMRYGSEMWFQPMLMYGAALSVKALGLSEGAIRFPMALAGIVDVVLMYAIGRVLFGRQLPAIVAAALLAVTPAHFLNARVAMDFQMPLPFVLGWLLCVSIYLRSGQRLLLLAAGFLLGVGLYTYIAAYMLMPVYAALTGVVLYWRGERADRYWLLVAGFVAPAVCCLPFLLTHSTMIHDIFWHYERDKPNSTGAFELLTAFVNRDRLMTAASLYWRFWNPRFLFVDGPQSAWVAGVFLLPTAGLGAIGTLDLVRRRDPSAVLLLGGLVTAPIPASLVGDGEAIHRAAAVLPFVVLLAAAGLSYLRAATPLRARILAFAALWMATIGLASAYHDQLPLAQAIVRAASVPLALAALFVLSKFEPVILPHAAIAAFTLAAFQIAFAVLGYALVAWTSAIVLSGIAVLLSARRPATEHPFSPLLAVVALTAGVSDFVAAYADYPNVHRVQFVPASAIASAIRFAVGLVALAAMCAIAPVARRWAARLRGNTVVPMTAAMLIAVQVAYFYIDAFAEYRIRLVVAIMVMIGTVAAAAMAQGLAGARARIGELTAVALAGVAALQFAVFYADYCTRYRVQAGSLDPEGNARVAWETVIGRAGQRPVPAVYLSEVGPYGFGDLYWRFYTIKHHREDLLGRTISDVEFNPDRVRTLPGASLVVTGRSPQTTHAIDRMLAAGELRDKTLVVAADGTNSFWVLETAAPHSGRAAP